MNARIAFPLVMAAFLFAYLPSISSGQAPKGPPGGRTDLTCTGTVKDVAPGLFQMTTDDGEQWIVKVEAQPKDVTYTGSAEVGFLKPGLFVRFTSKINGRGQTADKVGEFTVITPKADVPLGLNTEETTKAGDGLFNGGATEKRPKPKPKPKADSDPTYEISGRITKVTRTEITVNAAGTPIRAQLGEQTSVALDVSDLSYLRPGDKIEFAGWYNAAQKGQAFATRVTATGSQPIAEENGAAKSKPSARQKPGTNAARKDAP